MRHEKRRFVEKVDYVTSPGWIDGPAGRKNAGLPENKGPAAVVTTLGVMRFDPESRRMYLSEYYPGVTPQKVREQTGFPIDLSRAVEADAPGEEVLYVLRRIDRDHLYI